MIDGKIIKAFIAALPDIDAFVRENADGSWTVDGTIDLAAALEAAFAASQDAPASAVLKGIDSQVIVAAREMSEEQKRQPEWIWADRDGHMTFGRWSKLAMTAPYIRADIALAARDEIIDFIVRWVWLSDKMDMHDTERLSAIKYYPPIKQRADAVRTAALEHTGGNSE